MVRSFTLMLLVVAAGSMLAACSSEPTPTQTSYTPPSQAGIAACGAVGDCAPSAPAPYPMHGDYGAY
jgi:hypothetical protein